MNLKGRAVLLTGASGGIGRATALRLARHGARVALFARHPDPLRALAKEIENAGGEALAIPGDVCSTVDAYRAVVETTSRFGRIVSERTPTRSVAGSSRDEASSRMTRSHLRELSVPKRGSMP